MTVRVIFEDLIDAATLGASPALVSTLDETNLQSSKRARVARTTSTANQAITGDFAASSIVSAAVLWRHNLSEDATWRLRLYSAASQSGTVVYDSGTIDAITKKTYGDLIYGVDPYGASVFESGPDLKFSVFWFDAVFALSFQLDLSDSGNSDGYMEADRLHMGYHFEPSVNASYGLQIQWMDDSTQTRTEGNSVHSDPLEPYRRLVFDLRYLSDSERTKFLENTRKAGKRKDVFVSVYPMQGGEQERDHSFIGRLVETPGLTHSWFDNHQTRVVIEES